MSNYGNTYIELIDVSRISRIKVVKIKSARKKTYVGFHCLAKKFINLF